MSEPPAPPETGAQAAAGLPPEVLDRLRRSVPLRMDAMGRLTLGGDPVTHPRVDAVLRRGLDVTDAGEFTVRIGPHWCYLTATDCPLRALAVTGTPPQPPMLRLDDGRAVALAAASLWDEPDRGLRCSVPSGGSERLLPVRFTNRAQMDLLPWLQIDDDGRGTLAISGEDYVIPTAAPT